VRHNHEQHGAWVLVDRVQVLNVGHIFFAFDYCPLIFSVVCNSNEIRPDG
jgi:hypothetical protein